MTQTEKSEVVEMTPTWASELLKHNATNRKITRSRIEDYKRDIEAGRWIVNGTAIGLSKEGNLVDGQHRLMACIEAETPFHTFLTTGLDHVASFLTIDTGRPRTFADALSSRGVKSSTTVNAVVQLLYRYEHGSLGSNQRVNNQEADEVYQRHPNLVEFIDNNRNLPPKMGYSSIIFMHYLGNLVNEKVTEQFMTGFRTGANLEAGSPVLALRNYFLSNYNRASSTVLYDRAFVCIKALNAAITGKQIIVLRRAATEQMTGVYSLPYGKLINANIIASQKAA